MQLIQVEKEALNLSEQERAVLAAHLLYSLDAAGADCYEAAWVAEAENRYKAYKSGHLTTRDSGAVMRDAHDRL